MSHFFGGKSRLFIAVTFPPFPLERLEVVAQGPSREAGRRLAEFFVSVLDDETVRSRFVGLVRAATAEPEAAELLRRMLGAGPLTRVVEALGADDPELRANLAGSQLIGLVIARYVVAVAPIATLPARTLVEAIAPTLQRYLTEPLGP